MPLKVTLAVAVVAAVPTVAVKAVVVAVEEVAVAAVEVVVVVAEVNTFQTRHSGSGR